MNIYSRKRKMKSVRNKNLDVFDFEENEVSTTAIDKYTFLTTAASGKTYSAEEISYVPSLDIDAIKSTHFATTLLEVPSTRMAGSDAFIVDEHPSKSSPVLRTELSESEVNPPAGSEVNPPAGSEVNAPAEAEVYEAATSSSPDNVKLRTDLSEAEVTPPAGSKVNVAATSASPDNVKLRTDLSEAEVTPPAEAEDETVQMDLDESGSMCERSSSSSDDALKEDDATSGKTYSAEEISYVPSLDIDAINISHFTPLEVPSTRMADSDAFIVDEHPSKSSPKLRTELSESEVNPPAGSEVNAAATSASPDNVKLRTGLSEAEATVSKVNVAATSASPDKVKLRTVFSESNLIAGADVNAPPGAEVNVGIVSASPDNIQLSSTILDLFPSLLEIDETVEMDPNENGSTCERSSSSSDDGLKEDDDVGPSSDHYIGQWESGSEDTIVAFYPEHMVYRDSVYTDSMISFTSSFIEMKGLTADGDDQTLKCKWGIGDILHLSYQLYEAVEMVMVKIRVLSKGTILTENAECTSASELKFAVIGSNWYDKLEAIISLNIEYKALWSSILEPEDTADGHTRVSFSKYLPNFDSPFEEVVYPKGDADAVSISKRDFDLLQPDTFVNDTIIDFYIKYLKNKIMPEERNRFHFFNSFFFRKLADLDKDPLNASDGAAAYQRVKKWTRKVNLFQKDYVFIPANYNYHWSLIVMCHLGELATYEDEDAEELIKVPCVLHMDSFRGSHIGLKGLVQSYLKEEWKGRQHEASEDISSKFDNLRFIYLELPQQQNLFDCGLFLLHYVELFLEQAPLHFNPFKFSESTNFLNIDWFPPAEASLKRVVIQKLISDLLNNPYQETSSAAINAKQCHLSSPTTNIHKGSAVNLFPENCNPSMHSDHGIGVSLSPLCADDPIVALNPCFESESFTGIHFSDCNHTTSFDKDKGFLTPIEEDTENGTQFVYSQTEHGTQQDNGIISDDPALPYPSPAIAIYQHVTLESSPETSISGSEEFIKIVNEKSQQIDSENNEPRSPVNYDDPASSMDMQPTKKARMTEIM